MKNLKTQFAVLLLSTVCLLTGAFGQLTPSGDSYTNTAAATTNYGAKTLLDVESSQTTFIQFDLSSIPSGYTSADITKATLKLYVNAVTTAGSFNVDYVNGTWTESTIDASNAPALGTTIAASVPLVTKDKNQYILVDITAAVQAWLSGTANDGIALVANSPLNASFDSKESTTTSHSPELDIVYAGIAGVSTASGSGLIGGGTSGTLNLALTNTCATNQVLHWNGTSWACAAVGTGTVTSVGSGTGLTGGPITGSGTLSINTAVVPLLAAANTFTGNQTINGAGAVGNYGLTVNQPSQTGILLEGPITGPGAGLDFKTTGTGGKQWEILATGSTASQGVGKLNIRDVNSSTDVLTIDAADTVNVNTNLNVAGGAVTFTGSQTVNGNITAGTSGSSSLGVLGEANASSGQTYGVGGLAASPAGYGVEGLNLAAGGVGVYGYDTAGTGVSGNGGTYGVYGTAPQYGLYGTATGSGSTAGVYGSGAFGVFASGTAFGVYGSGVTGVYGVGTNSGVYGTTNSSIYPAVSGEGLSVGVYGAASGGSNTSGGNAGIWGDTGGAAGAYTAVVGTAADNPAGGFYNNSADSPTITATNASSDGAAISGNGGDTGIEGTGDVYGVIGTGSSFGGYFTGYAPLVAYAPMGYCAVNDAGSLICTGSKSAAVPLADDRWVRLYAVESPENWFEDFGSGQLSNGSAVVALEPIFAQTINTGTDYHVFLTPSGDSRGLYVFAKTATSFEVREQGGGKSSIAFDYRIVARRKGYENIRMEDVTEFHARIAAENERIAKRIPSHTPPAMKTGDGRRRAPQSVPITPKLLPTPPLRPAVQPVAAQLK